jgi:diacylglycerol O-acyltransferase/trehalose O-mycolyltransferase
VYCGNGKPSDLGGDNLPAKFLEGFVRDSNLKWQDGLQRAPAATTRCSTSTPMARTDWPYWGSQLHAMLPDLQRTLGATPGAGPGPGAAPGAPAAAATGQHT